MKPKEKRYRDKQIILRLTDYEKAVFTAKQFYAREKTMNDFIRKCVLQKEIFVIDMTLFRKTNTLLGNISNNVNQIARKVNTMAVIYRDDIRSLQKEINHLAKIVNKTHDYILSLIQKSEVS